MERQRYQRHNQSLEPAVVLDVYKRQLLADLALCGTSLFVVRIVVAGGQNVGTPVSYTHLRL